MILRSTSSTPNTVVARCLMAVVIATVVLASGMPAIGQERMVLGPRQFEHDKGAGAVLCIWSLYLTVQAETAACGLARRPVDDAIDAAIVAIDEFILANSSLRPTRAMLNGFKRRAADSHLNFARRHGMAKSCGSRDIEHFRKADPDQIRASTMALLAVPREPVMNPCL